MVKRHFPVDSQDTRRSCYHWNFKGEELQNIFLPPAFWLVLHLWITSMSRFNKSTQIHNFRVNKWHKADQINLWSWGFRFSLTIIRNETTKNFKQKKKYTLLSYPKTFTIKTSAVRLKLGKKIKCSAKRRTNPRLELEA